MMYSMRESASSSPRAKMRRSPRYVDDDREVPGRHLGVEHDRHVAGALDREDRGHLIEEPPARTAKALPAELRSEHAPPHA